MNTSEPYQPYPNSLIDLKGASYLLFIACYRVKKENKAKMSIVPEKKSEIDTNETYIQLSFKFKDSNLDIDNMFSSSQDDNNHQDHLENMVFYFKKEI